MNFKEYNFDGLAGPTHHFGGLAVGNLASEKSRFQISHPCAAALQGLSKMKLLLDLGIPQGIIPPQERPDIFYLKAQGLTGSEEEILEKAGRKDQTLLLTSYSASSMWTANAATVSPAADCEDQRIHFTPANLVTEKHRALEPPQAASVLKKIFFDPRFFVHHPPLPDEGTLFDEGAANWMRLAPAQGEPGIEIFVYGKDMEKAERNVPLRYPARQSFQASRVVALTHRLKEGRVVFVQQNPEAIDAGVFHNDVIAAANEHILLAHESAFLDAEKFLGEIEEQFRNISGRELTTIKITEQQLSLEDAVGTYFFNSQIVTRPDGNMALIAPRECRQGVGRDVIEEILCAENPIAEVHFVDLDESMRNGGGPACLRLRVELSEEALAGVHRGCLLSGQLFAQLENWVRRHYRETLRVEDLRDPRLMRESRAALDELTKILGLGSLYAFQR